MTCRAVTAISAAAAVLVLRPSSFGTDYRAVHALTHAPLARNRAIGKPAALGIAAGDPFSMLLHKHASGRRSIRSCSASSLSSACSASALHVARSPTEADVTGGGGGSAADQINDPHRFVANLTKKAILSAPTSASSTVADESTDHVPPVDGVTDVAEEHSNHWITHDKHVLVGHDDDDGDNADPSRHPMDDAIVPEAAALVLSADESHDDLTSDQTPDHAKLPPSERKIWEGATWREKRGLKASHIPEKLFNAGLLALSFGFALYTVINVDSEITRGWTQSEIAMRIPLDTWSSYEASLSSKPIETKTLINVVIYLLGDWLSQTVFQKKDVLDFDAARTLRNGFIGLCFGPLVHQYYEFSDSILPVDVGINRLYKIVMDQTIYLFVKCSVYIIAVGTLSGQSFEESTDNAKERIGPIMFTAWKFWPLVHCVTYSVIPAQHRILWVNSVDLVWNAILATKASDAEEREDGAPAEAEDGADLLVSEFGELDGVQIMEGTDVSAAVKGPTLESTTSQAVDDAVEVEEEPRLTLLEQYRKLNV